jgi:hypothetical protein
MRALRTLALLLSSGGFFLVSCSSSLFLGVQVIADSDARDVAGGDQVHEWFEIALAPGDEGQAFKVIELRRLPELQQGGEDYSLLMPASGDSVGEDPYRIEYTVLEQTGSELVGPDEGDAEQLIEVYTSNDDVSAWSRYRATRTTIEPISSRMLHPGYMFASMPWALGIAFAIYFLGKLLLRVAGTPERAEATEP